MSMQKIVGDEGILKLTVAANPPDGSTPAEETVITLNAGEARLVGATILTVLAIIGALYFGRELILPIVMAALLNMLLQPGLQLMHSKARVPMPLAALVLILLVFAAIAAFGYVITIPSGAWLEKIPGSFVVLKQKLAFLAEPIGYLQDMLHNIENIASGPKTGGGPIAVTSGDALPGVVLFGTAATARVFLTTMLVLYFMLASGDRLLRGLIQVLPTFRDKRRAVEIAGEIQSNITAYLATISLMNAAVGVATAFAMWACGLGDPVLWGAMAFLLNFIPIIGPLLGVAIFFIAGVAALPWPFPALAPAILYLLIHIAEGEVITPLLLARHFSLNPVLIILSLLFWDFLWGTPGAVLAVPLLATFKIFADRIQPLQPLGHLIGS